MEILIGKGFIVQRKNNEKSAKAFSIIVTALITALLISAGYFYFYNWNIHGVSNILQIHSDFTKEDVLKKVGTCDGKSVYTYGLEELGYETFTGKFIPLSDYLEKKWVTQDTLIKGGYKTYINSRIVVRFEVYYVIVLSDKLVYVANDVEFKRIMDEIDLL